MLDFTFSGNRTPDFGVASAMRILQKQPHATKTYHHSERLNPGYTATSSFDLKKFTGLLTRTVLLMQDAINRRKPQAEIQC